MEKIKTAVWLIVFMGLCYTGYAQSDEGATIIDRDMISGELNVAGYKVPGGSYKISGGVGFSHNIWITRNPELKSLWSINWSLRFLGLPEADDDEEDSYGSSLSVAMLGRATIPMNGPEGEWFYFAAIGPEVFIPFFDGKRSYLGQMQAGIMRHNAGRSFLSNWETGISLSYDVASRSDDITLLNTLFFRFRF